jgi:peptidyl-prolyl cis-trans isomerase B (cyclophilin B)
VLAAAPMVALTLALAVGACGGGDDEDDQASPAGAPEPATAGCRAVEKPGARPEGGEQPPAAILSPAKTYRVVVETSCGNFTITLEPKASPKTTASFLELARNDFYDGTYFHRIVPNFVIQGGDPTGVGTGGPGYTTVDTPAANTRYTNGVVAMAKTAAEAPGTAGSQFFIVTARDAGLPPEYALIGRVTDGREVVARIGALGDPATELPTQPVVIEDMVVRVE